MSVVRLDGKIENNRKPLVTMVRISMTDYFRRAINRSMGKPGLATRKQIIAFVDKWVSAGIEQAIEGEDE